MEKQLLKIGLMTSSDYGKIKSKIKQSDIDLLVFPEFSFDEQFENLSFYEGEDDEKIYQLVSNLSETLDKPIIVNGVDKYDSNISIYYNCKADINETEKSFYIKHTCSENSSFESDCEEYLNDAKAMFAPIILKGNKIGMTICYDCNHSLFSRIYGLQGVDILINSTGGDVNAIKWGRYNKVRAIENNCFSFVTMNRYGDPIDNCVYGFAPSGKRMNYENQIGNELFIFSTANTNAIGEPDVRLSQNETLNNNEVIRIPARGIDKYLKEAKKLKDNLFIRKEGDKNIVLAVVNGEDIMRPEIILPLLFDSKLKSYTNKGYVIISKFEHIDKTYFENILSDVLKVRAIENYCAVLLESSNIQKCYQPTQTKDIQVIKEYQNCFGIDTLRISGAECIWKNKRTRNGNIAMRASWRNNYEKLIEVSQDIKKFMRE